MIEFLAIGSGVAFLVNRFVLGTKRPETPAAQAPPPVAQVAGGVILDNPIEPRTAEGVMHLLQHGTCEQLDTAAISLIRTGYPIASRQCADRSASLRARERFQAAKAEREKRLADEKAELDAKLKAIEEAGKDKPNASAAAE